MKVLHITYDVVPQSAPLRVHEALLAAGVDSYIYALGESSGAGKIVYGRQYSFPVRAWRRGRLMFYRLVEGVLRRVFRCRTGVPISLGIGSLLDRQFIREFAPDVVNLHWICGNFVSAADVAWLSRNFPVAWTLHDSWAFTGGCHVPQACTKWQRECRDCPLIGKRFGLDLARWVFRRKAKYYAQGDFKVIGVSNWLADCARKSRLLGGKQAFVGHNTLNQEVFKPMDKGFLRQMLGLPRKKRLILFGAMHSTSDANKGFDLLHAAIRHLVEEHLATDFELMVFGSYAPENPPDFGAKVHYMGRFRDNLSLAVLYGAADIMIVPSRSESFPNTVLESQNCGTPVAAFRIGGIPDQVDHLQNGYLAEPYDSADLARGIAYILGDEERRRAMGRAGREKAERIFSRERIAADYLAIYEEITRGGST